jgi:hypothetical protein
MRWLGVLAPVALPAVCACMATASLREFPSVGVQLHQGDSDVTRGVHAYVNLGAPHDCPALDTRTSILVNGQGPVTSAWGTTIDQGECQPPTFEFSLPLGDDAEVVMTGNGHVDDVIVRHGLAPRRFVMPPVPLIVAPGGSFQIEWSGVSGEAPEFDASLVTSKTIHSVTVTPSGTGIAIGIPADVAPGDYKLELFASITPTPSVCSGIASCSAFVMVDAQLPVAVAAARTYNR